MPKVKCGTCGKVNSLNDYVYWCSKCGRVLIIPKIMREEDMQERTTNRRTGQDVDQVDG